MAALSHLATDVITLLIACSALLLLTEMKGLQRDGRRPPLRQVVAAPTPAPAPPPPGGGPAAEAEATAECSGSSQQQQAAAPPTPPLILLPLLDMGARHPRNIPWCGGSCIRVRVVHRRERGSSAGRHA